VEYHITHYDLEQGALEIQYIEEYFGEFPRKKTAAEIVRRLSDRPHLILIASGALPDDPGPCSRCRTRSPTKFAPMSKEPSSQSWFIVFTTSCSSTDARCFIPGSAARVEIGVGRAFPCSHRTAGALGNRAGLRRGRRQDEEQVLRDAWTLDHLRFEVIKYERDPIDNAESKVYLSKRLHPELLERHRSSRTVVQATI
jgi:hypothetical protein